MWREDAFIVVILKRHAWRSGTRTLALLAAHNGFRQFFSLFSKLLKHAKMPQLQRSSLGQTNFDWADRGQITGVPTVQEDFTHRLFWISRT